MTLQEISSYFNGVTRFKDNSFQCKCPAHNDHTASMTVSKGKKGILIHCHAGCETKSILKATGLQESDLFYNSTKKKQGWKDRLERTKKKKIVEIYDYKDQNNKYLYSKIRFEKDQNDRKEMLYGVLDSENDWFQYGLKSVGKHKVLYNLPEIKQAAAQKQTIYYVEGEKDVETLRGLGLIATTAGSSGDWRRSFSKYFSGADVVLLPDNDEAGERLTTKIINDLIGVANSLKVVKTSERNHGDVTDYFQDGYTIEDFNKLVNEAKIISQDQQQEVNSLKKKNKIPQWISDKITELKPENNYSYDDRGNGDLFAEVFKGVCRFNSTANCWYCYNGKFWEEDRSELIVAEKAKILQDALWVYAATIEDYKLREEYSKHVIKLGRQHVRKNMIIDARSKYPVKTDLFDQKSNLFNCKNGTYNLETGILQNHNPEDYISKISNVYYDPAAKSVEIDKILNTIMQGNKENVEYIQKILGMALAGNTDEEKLFLFYGATTRNGKSTLVETYLSMIKDYGTTMQPESLALRKKDSRAASGDIARLKGMRFVNAPEPPQNMRFDASLIKQLTGNDMITARKLHESEISFMPEFISVINTNHLPIITDETLFTSGRIVVIPFKKHFTAKEQDKGLKRRLKRKKNISGFFNWCVAGYQKYLKDGLETTESMNLEIESYHINSDKIAAFISEKLTEDWNRAVTIKELYPEYEHWCVHNNYQAFGKSKFTDYFRRSGRLKNVATINGKQYKNVVKGYYINPFEK